MATSFKVLIPAKHAENVATVQYTASSVKAVLDKFTATNTSGSTVTLTVYLVSSGDTASDSNKILDARAVVPGECYTCPELVGHGLNIGGFIVTEASAASAITIRCSGREISSS